LDEADYIEITQLKNEDGDIVSLLPQLGITNEILALMNFDCFKNYSP